LRLGNRDSLNGAGSDRRGDNGGAPERVEQRGFETIELFPSPLGLGGAGKQSGQPIGERESFQLVVEEGVYPPELLPRPGVFSSVSLAMVR